MTRKQLNRYETICRTLDGSMTIQEAATILNLSARQVQRLKKEVSVKGPEALIHSNTGRTPSNALSTETIDRIIELKKSSQFKECNFLHFKEILEEYYEIRISYAALRLLLVSNGIQSPKKRRRYKPHRRRSRRPQAGALLQIDATTHSWFKGDRKKYSLHGAIDDATGQITALYMTKNECLLGYFKMLQLTIENFGIPVSIYADRHTIFRSPNADKAEVDSNVKVNDTQFGRSLSELGVELIPARSPQAKGRIERLWQTLQSRLPVEFELNGITDMTSANEFLKQYIYAYNSQFAVEPNSRDSLFSPIEDSVQLENILCVKATRKLDVGGIFSYNSRSYKIIDNEHTVHLYGGSAITVLAHPSYGIRASYKGNIIDVLPYVPAKGQSKRKAKKSESTHKASPINYSFNPSLKEKQESWDLTWEETIDMVNTIFSARY